MWFISLWTVKVHQQSHWQQWASFSRGTETRSESPGRFCSWFQGPRRRCTWPPSNRWPEKQESSTAAGHSTKHGERTVKEKQTRHVGYATSEWKDNKVYTTINGKIMPMRKKDVQLTEPPIMYAAGRVVCVNSSVVKMFVTPPVTRSTIIHNYCVFLVVCASAHKQYRCAFNTCLLFQLVSHVPGPRPKLRIKAKTQIILR